MLRLVWGITGAGDMLVETVDEMSKVVKSGQVELVTVLSAAASNVVKMYKVDEQINLISNKVSVEINANNPFISGDLQTNKYDGLILAPATANTVAKIVHGIADTVLTNAAAMTNKTDNPVIILPVDLKTGGTITTLPDGNQMKLNIRRVDARNADVLKRMEGIKVLNHPKEIPGELGQLKPNKL